MCNDSSVIGTPFYIMEHLDGQIFTDPDLPDLTPAARAAVYEEMCTVLASLHSVDPTTCGLQHFGKHQGCNERQVGLN